MSESRTVKEKPKPPPKPSSVRFTKGPPTLPRNPPVGKVQPVSPLCVSNQPTTGSASRQPAKNVPPRPAPKPRRLSAQFQNKTTSGTDDVVNNNVPSIKVVDVEKTECSSTEPGSTSIPSPTNRPKPRQRRSLISKSSSSSQPSSLLNDVTKTDAIRDVIVKENDPHDCNEDIQHSHESSSEGILEPLDLDRCKFAKTDPLPRHEEKKSPKLVVCREAGSSIFYDMDSAISNTATPTAVTLTDGSKLTEDSLTDNSPSSVQTKNVLEIEVKPTSGKLVASDPDNVFDNKNSDANSLGSSKSDSVSSDYEEITSPYDAVVQMINEPNDVEVHNTNLFDVQQEILEKNDVVAPELPPKRPPRKKSVSKSLSFVRAIKDKIQHSSTENLSLGRENMKPAQESPEVTRKLSLPRSYSCDDMLSELNTSVRHFAMRTSKSEEDLLSDNAKTLKRSQTIACADVCDGTSNVPLLTKHTTRFVKQSSLNALPQDPAKRRLPPIPPGEQMNQQDSPARRPLPCLPHNTDANKSDGVRKPPLLPPRAHRERSNSAGSQTRKSRAPAPPPKQQINDSIDIPVTDSDGDSDCSTGIYDADGYLQPVDSRHNLSADYSYVDLPEDVLRMAARKASPSIKKRKSRSRCSSSVFMEHDYEYVPEERSAQSGSKLSVSSTGNSQFYFDIDESNPSTKQDDQKPPSPPVRNTKKIRRKSEGLFSKLKSVVSSNSTDNLPAPPVKGSSSSDIPGASVKKPTQHGTSTSTSDDAEQICENNNMPVPVSPNVPDSLNNNSPENVPNSDRTNRTTNINSNTDVEPVNKCAVPSVNISDNVQQGSLVDAYSVVPILSGTDLDQDVPSSSDISMDGVGLCGDISFSSGDGVISSIQSQPLPSPPARVSEEGCPHSPLLSPRASINSNKTLVFDDINDVGDVYSEIPDDDNMERRMNRISSSSSTSSSSYEITRRAPPIPQRGMGGSSAKSSPSLNTSARNSPNSGSARNSPVPSSFTTDKPQSTPLLMHPNCRNRGVIPEDRVDNTPISPLLNDDNLSVHHTGSKSLSSHPSITSSHSHESYLSSSSSNISSEVSLRSRSSHYSCSSTRTDASGMSFMVSDSESDEDDRYEEISENLKQPTLEQQRILQMDKKERKVFYIAREIMTTERSFVQVLRLVNLDLRVSIDQMSSRLSQPVVPVGVVNQLFKALPVLQKFNEDLLKDLENRIDKWESNPCIADIFVMKGQFLKLYSPYIKDFEAMSKSLDDARKKFPGFEQAIQQFEALPKCGNLSLRHFLLRPIQRIPQYRLLLTDYKKHLDEDAPDYEDTIKALDVVSQVAEHANDGMRDGDNFSKLWVIQHSLVGHFEVMKPGRTFYKEGQLNKLSRKEMQPRMFFLFSDVLLYTTPIGSGTYKLNNVLPLKDIRVSQPTKEDFQNEFSISSTHRSFTISASTANEKEEWLESLQNAIKVYARKQTSFGSVRSHKSNNGEAVLGSCAPVWIPDARVSMCALCTAAFTITFRRHHCRACGKVICGYCSDYRAPLGYLKYKSARVCKICYEALSKDIEGADDNMLFGDQERDDDGRKLDKQNIMKRFKNVRVSSFGKGKLRSKGSRPKVLKEVTANTEDSDMSGYLHIWRAKKWKQRWFVLKGHALYTYRASEDSAAKSSTVLLGYQIRPIDTNYRTQKRPWYEGVEASLVFELYHHGTEAMIFRTDSAASTQKWMKAMSDATVPGEIE